MMDLPISLQEDHVLLRETLSSTGELLTDIYPFYQEMELAAGDSGERPQPQSKRRMGAETEGQQMHALQHHLAETQISHWRQLEGLREAQQRQAVLVEKLQAKVLQYRSRCRDLEIQLHRSKHTRNWTDDQLQGEDERHTLEKLLIQLEEEQRRRESLAEVNTLLRDHLYKAKEMNKALGEDLHKLTADWTRALEELELKEGEWQKERVHFNSYIRGEQDRLLNLWKQVVAFRRHLLELKSSTERDLSEVRVDIFRFSGMLLSNCLHLSADSHPKLADMKVTHSPTDKDKKKRISELQHELLSKTQEVIYLQVKGDAEKAELQDRIAGLSMSLAELQKQNAEKEETEKLLTDTLDTLDMLEESRLESEVSLSQCVREEALYLQQKLKDITQVLVDEADSGLGLSLAEHFQEPKEESAWDADKAFILVQAVLEKRQAEAQELREQIASLQVSIDLLQAQVSKEQAAVEEQDAQRQKEQEDLEQRHILSQENTALKKDINRCSSRIETLTSECSGFKLEAESLRHRLELSEQEVQRLQRAHTDLQLQSDLANEEKEEQERKKTGAIRDCERTQNLLDGLEKKHSSLRTELASVHELLKKSQLEGELAKQEQQELEAVLGKSVQSVAELSVGQTRMKAEIADLRDAAGKMGALSETLAHDKVELNQQLMQGKWHRYVFRTEPKLQQDFIPY